MNPETIPFFRPQLTESEIEETVDTLRSGWLTTGPKVQRFEREFGEAVGARYAVAVNSCTAALHLAVEALDLRRGDHVLVPTMTFAATAEVVRYQGAVPVLVDCDPQTANLNLADAARLVTEKVVGIIPVHVGGLMMDIKAVQNFAAAHKLWVVEDAAHAFPVAWRPTEQDGWQRCGEDTAAVTCFSFYANKTITTGEGGMAVTNNPRLAERMRLMSLHGLSHDAWGRYQGVGCAWDYQILAPGFKYNLTDIAASIGLHQLRRAEAMRREREEIAMRYLTEWSNVEELELPPTNVNRLHSWHLFPVKLRLSRLNVDRNEFMQQLKRAGIGCSVHWRPLHLHPYYREHFGLRPEDYPVATQLWERLISLPLYSGLREAEIERIVKTVRQLCAKNARPVRAMTFAREEKRRRIAFGL